MNGALAASWQSDLLVLLMESDGSVCNVRCTDIIMQPSFLTPPLVKTQDIYVLDNISISVCVDNNVCCRENILEDASNTEGLM